MCTIDGMSYIAICFAWSGDNDSLKKFISEDLKLVGNREQPGGDKKNFKTDIKSKR